MTTLRSFLEGLRSSSQKSVCLLAATLLLILMIPRQEQFE